MGDGDRDDNKEMNTELFNELMKEPPEQQHSEWWVFLGICDMYLKRHKIKNPVVVELGIYSNKQKVFYEQLLGAEHIGINLPHRRLFPDITGDTHNPRTLESLKKKLEGRSINILFIDADHEYESVKEDFEMYSPLCSDIIAFHDLELRKRGVRKFWDELKGKHKDFLFLSIYQHRDSRIQMGTGIVMKR